MYCTLYILYVFGYTIKIINILYLIKYFSFSSYKPTIEVSLWYHIYSSDNSSLVSLTAVSADINKVFGLAGQKLQYSYPLHWYGVNITTTMLLLLYFDL